MVTPPMAPSTNNEPIGAIDQISGRIETHVHIVEIRVPLREVISAG